MPSWLPENCPPVLTLALALALALAPASELPMLDSNETRRDLPNMLVVEQLEVGVIS